MGQIFEVRTRIEQIIQRRGLDVAETRGKIGMKAGVLLSLIGPDTPDDPAKVAKLKQAAEQILAQSV